jgi:hypothetical protein
MCWPRFFDRLRPLAVLAPHLACRLVLTQAFVDDLAQQIVFGPGQELHLGHQLGPYPVHPAEHQGRAEAAAARRRQHVERHGVGRERLQPPP